MRWDAGACRISDDLMARVWQSKCAGWCAEIEVSGDESLWVKSGYADEAAAKAAVCYWIGKTMAQFSNALAEGYPEPPDDGA